jgi:hypothetical protein
MQNVVTISDPGGQSQTFLRFIRGILIPKWREKNGYNSNYSCPISEYLKAKGESKHIHEDFVDMGKNNNNNKEGRIVVGGWEAKGETGLCDVYDDLDAQQLFP